MTNSNSNPIAGSKGSNCIQDPSVQLTQLDWLGNLRRLLEAVENCFATNTCVVYNENLRAWNTSSGAASTEAGHNDRPDPDFNPYPERGPHKLPGVCSLTWRDGRWEIHLLIRDFLEVIEGLFADGRLNAIRHLPEGLANDFEVYLAGDFTVQRRSSELNSKGYYVPTTKCSL